MDPLKLRSKAWRLALGSLLLVMSPALFGQVVDDFDIRFQAQQNGGIQFLANTTMYCGTGSSCTQAQNAMPITGFPQDNNNGHSMQYYDGDNDPERGRPRQTASPLACVPK